jgi:AhpC/TSA family
MPPRRRISTRTANLIVAVPPVLVLIFLLVTWAFSDPVSRAAREAIGIRPGDPVPELVLRDGAGEAVPLAWLVGGGGVVVIVDSQCPHCHTELESLHRIASQQPSGAAPPQLVVVSSGDTAGAAQLRARYGALPIYADMERALDRKYGLRAIPVLLVVGSASTVREVRAGVQSEAQIRALLRPSST